MTRGVISCSNLILGGVNMTIKNAEYSVYNGTTFDQLHFKTDANLVNIADTGNLFTATNVEGALSELFINANNGKTAIANAVNAKGISASGADTFSVLATKIATTSLVNTADATVVASEMISGKTGYKNGTKVSGTMPIIGVDNVGGSVNGTLTAGRVYIKPSLGYWNGSVFTYWDEPNHIASNYLAGKTYFGLAGTAPNITTNASTPSGGYDGDFWIQP
jgi:hypothetical protein